MTETVMAQNQTLYADMARKMIADINALRCWGMLNICFQSETVSIEWKDRESLYTIKIQVDLTDATMMMDVLKDTQAAIANLAASATQLTQ